MYAMLICGPGCTHILSMVRVYALIISLSTMVLSPLVLLAGVFACPVTMYHNMQNFLGPNSTSALLLMAWQHSKWTTPPVGQSMGDVWLADDGFWPRWGDLSDSFDDLHLRGGRARLLSLAGLSLAARRAEDDAAGAAKAQQMAMSTASIQLP